MVSTERARLAMAEHELKAVLREVGVKVPPSVIIEPGADVPSRLPFAFPVAAKVSARYLLHKTDVGAVRLDVRDIEALRTAVEELRHSFPGVPLLIERMESGGVEAIVGFLRDPVFGLCAMIGVGGVFAELYQDVSFRRLPVSAADVLAMLEELRGRSVFWNFRGQQVSREALVRVVVSVGTWVIDHADSVQQMDLNPVFVREEDAVVIDAKLVGA